MFWKAQWSGEKLQVNVSRNLILLAEDDELHVELTLRGFRKRGFLNPVQVVKDGEEAIAYLSGKGQFADREKYPLPALLLLDLKMPNKNGFEVLEWVRAQPRFKRLPIVVLTSSGEIKDMKRAYDLGANSFLVKPVRTDDFFAVTETIKGWWLWMSAEPGSASTPLGKESPLPPPADGQDLRIPPA